MLEVNGLYLTVTMETILETLRDDMAQRGVTLFRSIKAGSSNIQFSCPIHKDGQERSPSCGITTTSVKRGDRTIQSGTVHCFTCGYTASLVEFISNVLGKRDGGIAGNNWLKENFQVMETMERPTLALDFSRHQPEVKARQKLVIPEHVLESFRYYHPYMWERNLNEEVVEKFDVGYDEDRKCLTFPVKDLEGQVVFVQTRSVNSKFHQYADGVNKTDYVYGAYEVMEYLKSHPHPNSVSVYITESILNCLTIWKHGCPAMSLMGTGGGKQYEILRELPVREYIEALDPDYAGSVASKRLFKELSKHKVMKHLVYLDGRDINELDGEWMECKPSLGGRNERHCSNDGTHSGKV